MSLDAFNIEIADEQSNPVDTDALVSIAKSILLEYGYQAAELSIAIVDDPTIRRLNKQYLNHDYETDVISFVLDEDETKLTGQLIVSTDTAARLAAEVNTTMQQELMLYVAHGTLHLVGLDDTNETSAQEMRSAEKRFLNQFSIPHRWQADNEDDEDDENSSNEGSSS